MDSMVRFTMVFPVPVTAFSHTAENDIIINATETTLITGIASVIKDASCPKKERKISGPMFNKMVKEAEHDKLRITIRLINGKTSSDFPCPITLLTIVFAVAAKDQEKTPKIPKIFLMVFEMAKARSPWC